MFGALIVAMILPFSAMLGATAQEAPDSVNDHIHSTVKQITPYVTVNSDTGNAVLDIESATRDGVPIDKVILSQVIINLQNEYVNGERDDVPLMEDYVTAVIEGEYPQVKKSVRCNWNGQIESPDRVNLPTNATTLSDAQDNLEDVGFHQVAFYALHPNAWFNGDLRDRNYQKSVEAHGCESGVFRGEAVIWNNSIRFTYSEPEPNPEYLDSSYIWPVWYWPTYLAEWHRTH